MIFATITYGCVQPPVKLLPNGTPAPDFTFDDAYGKPVRLSDYRGNVVVLCFWTAYYPGCLDAISAMGSAAQSFKGQKVAFVALNIWSEKDDFRNYVIDHPRLSLIHFAYDPEPEDADFAHLRYGVTGIPTILLIDKRGNILASGICGTQYYLTEDVQWALAQR